MGTLDPLTRIIKLASSSGTGDPGTDAMAAAAQAAKGPAGMPLLKMPKPGDKEGDESKDVMRIAHELDAKTKEINGLRTQLQEAKFESMRTQMKADIAAEQTKMRESLREEQARMHEKIRAEQKELDKRQSQLEMAEAESKAKHMAESAQHDADITASEAKHKANISVAEAQHKAQLDKDVSAHDAEIAQHKADSLMDIAQRTTDMYVKQTDKARADADKYFAGQDKQYRSTHPIISPALQNRLDGAMSSVNRVGKALAMMTAKQAAFFEKYAAPPVQQQPQQQPQQQTYNPTADAMYDKMRNATRYTSTTNVEEPANPSSGMPESKYYNPNEQSAADAADARHDTYFSRYMPENTDNVLDYAKALASQENEMYRMQQTGVDPKQIAAFRKRHLEAKREFEELKRRTQSAASAGDQDAREQMAQLGDASDDRGAWWWHEESDLDKIRNQYKNQQEEAGHSWLYRAGRGVLKFIDPVGPLANAIAENRQVQRMYARRGAERGWWGDGTGTGAAAAAAAARQRGLAVSALGNLGNIALGALEGPGMMLFNIATAGTLGTAAKVGLKGFRLARALGKGTGAAMRVGAKATGRYFVPKVTQGGYNAAKASMKEAWQGGRYWDATKGAFKTLGQTRGGAVAKSVLSSHGRLNGPAWTTVGGYMAYKHPKYIDANGNYAYGNEPLAYVNQQGRAELGNGYAYDEYNNAVNGQWGQPSVTVGVRHATPTRPTYGAQTGGAGGGRVGQLGQQKAASAVDAFMEKWASEHLLDTGALDRESFQNDPYWMDMADEGAYQYGLLNTAAPFIKAFTGLDIHPTRPMLPNMQRRLDPAEVQHAYERLVSPADGFTNDVARDIAARWQQHQGVPTRYMVPMGAN